MSSSNNKPRANSPTKSANHQKDALRQDCERCTEWLSEALRSSRPATLLNAMGGNIVKHAKTGNFSIELGNEKSSGTAQRNGPVLFSATTKNKEFPVSSSLSAGPDSRIVLLGSSADSQRDASVSIDNSSIATATSSAAQRERQIQTSNVLSRLSSQKITPQLDEAMEVQCTVCGSDGAEGAARAFVKGPNPVAVVLCANRLHSQSEVEEVLVHELMHVYDVRIKEMDLRNCQQLAYSEVRAAREAECHGSSRFFKSICVKDRATVATKNMFPSQGKDCVRAVFESAMKDDSPFAGSGTKSFFLKAPENESKTEPSPSAR